MAVQLQTGQKILHVKIRTLTGGTEKNPSQRTQKSLASGSKTVALIDQNAVEQEKQSV